MQKQWEATLNPTCEVKRSLTRLRALEDNDNGGKAKDVELAFLAASNVCWNRSVILVVAINYFSNIGLSINIRTY